MMKHVTCSLFLGFLSLNAMALPILTESMNGSGSLGTIYPDHENHNKVYFMPNRGALQKDSAGVPEFGMSYWGISKPSENPGGFFAGIFNLSVGSELQKAIDAHIASGKQVAVMPVQSSYIHFADKNGNRIMEMLFDDVDLPPFAGRAEDSFGIQATLTKVGAAALASQLRSGAAGLKIGYCYEVTGLSPIFNAKITLNYYKVYEHFLAQASYGRWWYKVNVRTEIEKLIENKTIKVEINGGTAQDKDYVMALMDRMVVKFFDPVLENRRNSVGGRIGISYTKIIEDRTQTFVMNQRELINREYCVDMSLGQLKDFPQLIVDADKTM